jgi:TonB family protein
VKRLVDFITMDKMSWRLKLKLAISSLSIATILFGSSVQAGKLDEPEIDRTPAGTQWWVAIWSPDATASEIYAYMKDEKNCDCPMWIMYNFDGRNVVLHTWGTNKDEIRYQSRLTNFIMSGLYVGPKPNTPYKTLSIVEKLKEKIKIEVVYIPNVAGDRNRPSLVSLPSLRQPVSDLEPQRLLEKEAAERKAKQEAAQIALTDLGLQRLLEKEAAQRKEAARIASKEAMRNNSLAAAAGNRDIHYGDKVGACVKPGVSFALLTRRDASNPAALYRVALAPNGQIAEVRLIKSSGDRGFDQAVETGIRRCSPFPRPSVGAYPSNIDINYKMYN